MTQIQPTNIISNCPPKFALVWSQSGTAYLVKMVATKKIAFMRCLLLFLLHLSIFSLTKAGKIRCEKLTIKMCKHFEYNMTRLPNRFHHEAQSETALEMHQYWPLIQIGCSSMLRFFLCTVYAPVCDITNKTFVPCRSVCKDARNGCIRIMKTYGFKWPQKLKCDLFPEKKNDPSCLDMEYDFTKETLPSLPTSSAQTDNTQYTSSTPSTTNPVTSSTNTRNPKCEKITIPLCKNLNYNMTHFPNRFLHEDQKEAALEVHQFWPLIQTNCSPMLKPFLCALYAPVCDNTDKTYVPCRSICKAARNGCLQIMKRYGFKWPQKLKCDLFPEKKNDPSCLDMEYDFTKETLPSLPTSSAQTDNTQYTSSTPSTTNPVTSSTNTRNPKCEKITVQMCKNLNYSMTHFPNQFWHEDQSEAALEVHQFWPLIQINCSPMLKPFLCSMYVPVCGDTDKTVRPCRSTCEEARKGCKDLMKTYGFKWPQKFNCVLFPEKKDDPYCLGKDFNATKEIMPTSVVHADLTVYSKPTRNDFIKSSMVKPTDVSAASTTYKPSNNRTCEKITITTCQKLRYNMTHYPNRFQHENQNAAALEINHFLPLIKIGCSSKLQFFLCSLYAPVCGDAKLLPCRSVCKHARKGCRRVMKRFGYKWPRKLNCRLFPRRRDDRSCLLH